MVYSVSLSEIENRLESYIDNNDMKRVKGTDIDYRYSLSDLENLIIYRHESCDVTDVDSADSSIEMVDEQCEEPQNLYEDDILCDELEDVDKFVGDTDFTSGVQDVDLLNSEDTLDDCDGFLDVDLTDEDADDLTEYSLESDNSGNLFGLDSANSGNNKDYDFSPQYGDEQGNQKCDDGDANSSDRSLSVDKASVVGIVNNKSLSKSPRDYSSLDIDKVYNIVAVFMKMNGVKNKGISQELLVKEFGSNVIKRLLSKSYLISLPDGTLTFNK